MSGLRLGYGLVVTLGLAGLLTLALIVPAVVSVPPRTIRAALGLDAIPPDVLARRQAEAIAMQVAACLRSAGIDAEPIVHPVAEPPDAELDPVAWAERWGFGVSTAVDRPTPSPVPDPNLAAATAHGRDARTAYLKAFLGDGSRPGCHEAASSAVLGLQTRVLAPLATDLASLDAAIDADPVVTVARQRYRTCLRAVIGPLADVHPASVVPALLDGYAARVTALGPDHRNLASIQVDERRAAAAVARCDRDRAQARARVAVRLESAFVAAHREALRTIRATLRREMAAWPKLSP